MKKTTHADLGTFKTLVSAQRAAEKYAAAWKKKRPRKKCACGPIAKGRVV